MVHMYLVLLKTTWTQVIGDLLRENLAFSEKTKIELILVVHWDTLYQTAKSPVTSERNIPVAYV